MRCTRVCVDLGRIDADRHTLAMPFAARVRYLRFAIDYHRDGSTQVRHGHFIGTIFPLLLALFGTAMVILLVAILKQQRIIRILNRETHRLVDRPVGFAYGFARRRLRWKDPMPRPHFFLRLAAPCLLLVLPLAACNPLDTAKTMINASDSAAAGADSQQAKHNPHPKRAYRITLTIDNAPGPFGSVQGVAQYNVTNSNECGKRLEFAGVILARSSNETFELTKVSDTRYEGTVYADLMLDEDYFGRGVCHWKFTEVRALLMATGDQKETTFIPNISAESIFAGQSKTEYFWNDRYPRSHMDGYGDSGKTDIDQFKPDIRNDLFAITLKAKEFEK